ncbi:MAG: hypothetical protein FWG06_04255, partial [Clostridiales bacterium]|nr:hypothetical protein [Clostridiales bacterium]
DLDAEFVLTDTYISDDLGSDWLNKHRPSAYKDGETTDLPFTITVNNEDNVINVVYLPTPPPVKYRYRVEYYKDDILTGEHLGTQNSTEDLDAEFVLTDTYISGDLGSDWLNKHRPSAYKDGETTDLPFTITVNNEDNVINVVYVASPAPKYPYIVKYYKIVDGVEIYMEGDDEDGITKFDKDITLVQDDVTADLESGWINRKKPAGYDDCPPGTVIYPTISDTGENIVKVVYTPTPPPVKYSYKIKFYKNTLDEGNCFDETDYVGEYDEGDDITEILAALDLDDTNWISSYRPSGYSFYSANYIIIKADETQNIVKVLYRANTPVNKDRDDKNNTGETTPADTPETTTATDPETGATVQTDQTDANGQTLIQQVVDFTAGTEPGDFPDIDFTATQPDPTKPGGTVRKAPPVPNTTSHKLTPRLGNDGDVVFVEFDEGGVPLGEWSWKNAEEMWIFEEYPPLDSWTLPRTNDAGAAIWLLLLALSLLGLGGAVLKQRRSKA